MHRFGHRARPPAFLAQTYADRTHEIDRLETEIGRERGELEHASAAANAKIAATGVPASFRAAERDVAGLDRQLADADKVLGGLEVERSWVDDGELLKAP